MEYLGALGGIAGMFLLACLSPGPVWMVITSTSIAVSRRAGVLAGLGVAGATLTWAAIAMLGLGVLLAKLAWLSTAIKLAGAAYLMWLGLRMIAGARRPAPAPGSLPAATRGGWAALRSGYLASITNPKAAAFFGSIFVVMLPADAPGWAHAAAVLQLAVLSAGWHCGLAVVFSVPSIQAGYRRAKARIDTAIGAVLIALGFRLAVSR
jgi:threonine/homoserine/homoserine lactone efflux protein